MKDAALVREVAAVYLRLFGSATQEHLREKADRSLALMDDLSAQVWLDIAASAVDQAKMWYVLYRKTSGGNHMSVHDGKVAAIEAAFRSQNDNLDVTEVGRVGGADTEIIGTDKLRQLRDLMREDDARRGAPNASFRPSLPPSAAPPLAYRSDASIMSGGSG